MLCKPKLHAELILTKCSSRVTIALLNRWPILLKEAIAVQEVEVWEEVAEVEGLNKEEPSEVELTSALATIANVRITFTRTVGIA